jgi:hypothetical protein
MTARRRALRVLVILGAVVASGTMLAAPALATRAVSIDVGRIDVTDQLAPGGEYKLPAFGVRNPGTESTTYRLVVSYVDGQSAGKPAESWFTFDPSTLTLGPGESQPVHARITLPPDTEPGEYAALIGPEIVAEGTGAQVGAGAAARLTFTVAPSSGLDAFLRWLFRFLAQNPWVLVVVALAIFAVVAWFLRRRFGLSISVNRRA